MPAAKVQRAESLRSERSDASQNNKRVSFNNDVDVKHIPRGAVVDRHGRLLGYLPPGDERRLVYNVYKEPTALSEQELAKEAERIIQQVDQITCVVSPNPANYETRSLERRSKRNNQEAEGQKNWSRTLPSSSTKNKLDKKNNYNQNNIVEKNVLHNNQVNVFGSTGSATGSELARKLDPILETSREAMTELGSMDRSKDTITPKYDSGIEMEAHIHNGHQHGDRPPLTRHNVNLIVQQLTEEARQREELRRRYEEEGIDITPKMPTLPVVGPDPTVGLSHNKNLPFSYTGGSPTRLSPLRPVRLSPPRRTDYEDRSRKNDIIYAQVVVEDGEREAAKKTIHTSLASPKDQSPERNLYRSSKGMVDKVPSHGKLFQNNSEIIRQHYGYQDDGQEEDDIDAIKAKARFLFGDEGYHHDNEHGRHYRSNKETARHEPSSLTYTDTTSDGLPTSANRYKVYKSGYNNFETAHQDKINTSYSKTNLQNNFRNETNKATGLSYKYSTLLKENPDKERNNYTTKVLISTDSESQDRIFQYSDDDDFRNGPESYENFIRQDRSLSPEPNQRRRPTHREQETRVSVGERIRSFEVNSPDTSPERYRRYRSEDVKQTTNKQQNLTSTQLIREAERGRTTKRPDFVSSRLVQQHVQQIRSTHDNNEEPPKPPLRTKKLRERLDQNSPPRRTVAASKWNQNERERITEGTTLHHNYSQQRTWRRDDNESKPERQVTLNKSTYNHRKDYPRSPKYRRPSSPDRDRHSDSPENDVRDNYPKDRREYYSDNDHRYQRFGYDHREGYRNDDDRSTSPSPERIFNTNRRYDVHESDTSGTRTAEPEKQDKIRRQRNKFLAVFLGSGKSNKVKSQQQQRGESRPTGPFPAESNSNTLKRETKGQTTKWDNHVDDGLLENHRNTTKTQREVKGPMATKWQSEISDGYTDNSLRKTESKRDVKVQSQRDVNIQGQNDSKIQIQREVKGQGQKQNWQDIDDTYRSGERVVKTTSWQTGYREKPKAFKENPPVRNERRRSSIDRTDTSESDDIRDERYKNARQKSQSFSNLQYRRDSDDDDQVDRDQWNTSTLNRLEVRHRRHHQDGKESRSPTRYEMNHEARPYASTNVIREKDELRTGIYDERHRHDYSRQPFPIPEEKNMRYFGDTDLESQQSGQRYRYAPKTKVLRSSSTAAGMGGVRRGLMQRQTGQPLQQQQQQQQQQKQPSSVNSSESEITSQTSNMVSGASADSQRSVYLHATTVADIPPATLLSQRRRVQSREDVSRLSPSVATTAPSTGATLRRTRHMSRSYSVLAPWKPKHYREKYEITYSNPQQPAQMVNNMGKPPRPPRRREEPSVDQVDARPVRNSVARSSTMPKDSKLAGWFRKKKR